MYGGFHGGPQLGPPYAERRQSLGQLGHQSLGRWRFSCVSLRIVAGTVSVCNHHTEKTMFPFPFTLNGIWSWWQFSFRFWTKWNSIWLRIEKKAVTTTISHSIWKEIEYMFSQCIRHVIWYDRTASVCNHQTVRWYGQKIHTYIWDGQKHLGPEPAHAVYTVHCPLNVPNIWIKKSAIVLFSLLYQ